MLSEVVVNPPNHIPGSPINMLRDQISIDPFAAIHYRFSFDGS